MEWVIADGEKGLTEVALLTPHRETKKRLS